MKKAKTRDFLAPVMWLWKVVKLVPDYTKPQTEKGPNTGTFRSDLKIQQEQFFVAAKIEDIWEELKYEQAEGEEIGSISRLVPVIKTRKQWEKENE